MKKHRKITREKVILLVLASLWAIICLFPLWHLFAATFSSDSTNVTTAFMPNDLKNGFAKVAYALTTGSILEASLDTFIYSMFTIVGLVFISALAAYEFSFYQFPFKKILFASLMASMMLPLVLYVIPLYRFVFQIGMADTVWGVSLPMMVAPLAVFMLMQFLEDLPISLIESARIDGAGHFKIFTAIVFPLMRNGVITVTVVMFLRIWGNLLWPSLITANKIKPLSVAISNMLSPNFYVDQRVKIASMLISMLPPAILYLACQKRVIEGMTMSAVKG